MKLWLIEGKGWETSFTIMRAETRDEAVYRVLGNVAADCVVIELSPEGDTQVLWSWEHSPDSNDYD